MRDEQKIAVIFEMMKRKCIKSDSDRPPSTPNIVNVPQDSLPVSTFTLILLSVLAFSFDVSLLDKNSMIRCLEVRRNLILFYCYYPGPPPYLTLALHELSQSILCILLV